MLKENYSKLLIIVVTVALTFVGCNRKTIFSHYESTPVEGWEMGEDLLFDVGRVMEDGTYETAIGIRTTLDYPYTSLTLIVEQDVRPGLRKYVDTVSVELMDHDGTVLGKGVSAFQYVIPYRRLQLNKDDSLHVAVSHCMAREMLPGILDVGLIVSSTDSRE